MVAVPSLLLLAAILVGLIPGAVPGIETAAAHLGDHPTYAAWVLGAGAHFPSTAPSHVEGFDYAYGVAASLGALMLAALGLFGRPLRDRVPKSCWSRWCGGVNGLRTLHSGHIGDYIAWWTTGAALLGGASLIFLR